MYTMYIKSNSKLKANLFLQNNVVGIIVPDPEVMPGWAKKEGISPDMTELCKNKVIIQRTMSSEFFSRSHFISDSRKHALFYFIQKIKGADSL